MAVAQSRWGSLCHSPGELEHKRVKRFLWSQPSSWSHSQELNPHFCRFHQSISQLSEVFSPNIYRQEMHWDLFVCDFNKPGCDSLGRKCTVKSYGLQNLITPVTQSAALTKGCSTSLPGQGNASSSLIPLGVMPLAWIRHHKRPTVMPAQAEVSFLLWKFGIWATLALKRSLILQPRPQHGLVTLQSSSLGWQWRSSQASLFPWLPTAL